MDLLRVEDLTLNIDDRVLLQNVNLRIEPGETHVLFGANGLRQDRTAQGDNIVIDAETPGIKKEGIEASVQNNIFIFWLPYPVASIATEETRQNPGRPQKDP